MIKVTLEIDNKFAASITPLEFLYKYILKDAVPLTRTVIENPSAIIKIVSISQE